MHIYNYKKYTGLCALHPGVYNLCTRMYVVLTPGCKGDEDGDVRQLLNLICTIYIQGYCKTDRYVLTMMLQ